MKYAKPIVDRQIYHKIIEYEINRVMDVLIYKPILEISEKILTSRETMPAGVTPRRFLNSLACGDPNFIFQGLPIVIENRKGTYREGKGWRQLMANDYGYVCGTEAIDGDEVDCFIGPNFTSVKMYVVEQNFPGTDDFDEYKVMLGFNEITEAKAAYFANYKPNWTGFKSITEYHQDWFWNWYMTSKRLVFQNAISSALKTALTNGTIVYIDGFFTGKFNAAIGLEMRKLGAKFNHTRGAYALTRDKIPMDIQVIMSKGEAIIRKKVDEIYERLEYLRKTESLEPINFDPQFAGIVIDLDKQFSSTMPHGLNIPMSTSPYIANELKKNYTNNLNLYIKDWYDTAIIRLRKKVHDNVVEGNRAANLIPVIQAERMVSYNKAKFLAKQETSLLVSKYRESRYVEAGVRRYKWSTSHDERVRPDLEARKTGHTGNNHRILNNTIQTWDKPPQVNTRGQIIRAHPGEDFGCRCVAIPLLEGES